MNKVIPGLRRDRDYTIDEKARSVSLTDAGMTEVPFTPDTGGGGGDGQINSIVLSDGSVVIEFEGTLKSASNVTGPYAPVAGATSPYSVAPDQSAQFYIAE